MLASCRDLSRISLRLESKARAANITAETIAKLDPAKLMEMGRANDADSAKVKAFVAHLAWSPDNRFIKVRESSEQALQNFERDLEAARSTVEAARAALKKLDEKYDENLLAMHLRMKSGRAEEFDV